MSENDLELQAIRFRPGVIRTPQTDAVIKALDIYFASVGKTADVTSVKRTAESQLIIIQDYARTKGIIAKSFVMDFNTATTFEGKEYPLWQLIWSKLLTAGVIINPPIRAQVLTDYFKADGKNHKGDWIEPSGHFSGDCFDVGGGPNGCDDEYDIISRAKDEGVGLIYVKIERENNAVHCQVARV